MRYNIRHASPSAGRQSGPWTLGWKEAFIYPPTLEGGGWTDRVWCQWEGKCHHRGVMVEWRWVAVSGGAAEGWSMILFFFYPGQKFLEIK